MYTHELPLLENIIDQIVPTNTPTFTEKTAVDFVESILRLMESYIQENPQAITDPDFHEEFREQIEELIYITFEHDLVFNKEVEDELDEMIDESMEIFFNTFMPCRSFPDTRILCKPNIPALRKQITYLRSKPQPTQRTNAWYEFRHNLITASNAYKAFESESVKNQLIFEKCQPMKKEEDTANMPVSLVNVNTTLHWGQKYEPLSVMIYESLYDTKIEDFGCIQHDTYDFLGASPDGINVDTKSDRYGRMLEIKNIVNREIDGIPKKEYWIQMQLQMEVCNLDECDFLETKFVEYDNFNDFCNDEEQVIDEKGLNKGMIVYFSTNEGKPLYIYKPLHIVEQEQMIQWEEETIDKYQSATVNWIKTIYWKLAEISCVLVLRNKRWFKDNIQGIKKIWDIVKQERETGYEHRGPTKRIKKEILTLDQCFLNMNIETEKTNTINKLVNLFKKG